MAPCKSVAGWMLTYEFLATSGWTLGHFNYCYDWWLIKNWGNLAIKCEFSIHCRAMLACWLVHHFGPDGNISTTNLMDCHAIEHRYSEVEIILTVVMPRVLHITWYRHLCPPRDGFLITHGDPLSFDWGPSLGNFLIFLNMATFIPALFLVSAVSHSCYHCCRLVVLCLTANWRHYFRLWKYLMISVLCDIL